MGGGEVAFVRVSVVCDVSVSPERRPCSEDRDLDLECRSDIDDRLRRRKLEGGEVEGGETGSVSALSTTLGEEFVDRVLLTTTGDVGSLEGGGENDLEVTLSGRVDKGDDIPLEDEDRALGSGERTADATIGGFASGLGRGTVGDFGAEGSLGTTRLFCDRESGDGLRSIDRAVGGVWDTLAR